LSDGEDSYPGFYDRTQKCGVFYDDRACAGRASRCSKLAEGDGHRHPVGMTEADFSKKYDDENLSIWQVRIKADKTLVRQRKSIVEHPFGTINRAMDAGYCLTKGLGNVAGEFSCICLSIPPYCATMMR